MRRPPIVVVCCTAVALGVALACGDSDTVPAAPVGLKQIVIAAGDSQSAGLGATLVTPLKVRAVGSDNLPYPGVVVTWTVTQGLATAQQPTSVTNAAGEATTSLQLGLQTGPVRVTASVPGVTPAVFTATVVSTFPCQSITPFVFGAIGTLDTSDCNINGYYLDALSFTVPSQQSLSIRVTASAYDPWVGLYGGDGKFLAMNDDTLLGLAHNSWLNVIVPAGSYLITPSPFGPGDTGDYTVTAYGRPTALTGCDADTTYLGFMNPGLHYTGSDRSAVWLTRGVSFPETLTASDCVDASGPLYSDRAFIWLDANSVLTVREASTAFNAYLTLFGPNHFRAFNDDSANAATTTNAYLVVQAPVSAAYLLEFGTRDASKTGNYTISIAGAGPTAAATFVPR